MKVFKWIGEKVYNFVNNDLEVIFVLAIIGIVCAIVGHYGQVGFNWKWFVFFDIPLYTFCGWALYNVYKMYKHIKKK